MENSDKIAVVHRYVELFEKGDLAIVRELFADDATVEDPVGTEPHVGIEAVCAFYEFGLSLGAKLTLTGNPRCAGNAVAFPFQVKTPDRAIEVIDVFEFNPQGRIRSMRAYWGPENTTR